MTKSMHQFKLVNSTYELSEARDVLFSLINDKINSINGTIFSRYLKNGDDSEHLRNRVEELKEVKLKLMDYLLELNDEDCRIKISCPVIIEIESNQSVPNKELDTVL